MWKSCHSASRTIKTPLKIFILFAFSPRLFCKDTEMISGVFNSAFPVNYVEILSLCL
ncbi:hypothetical protein E2C01_081066 [Portunus trituberculatus]|uniref:Uncharacterized protein n=1 Tax=Portunus trituberculatus TaxID=210409 RepID=A0A5B7J194_PORTR|nr:hypothetical protein [Portunus trituberculatus]